MVLHEYYFCECGFFIYSPGENTMTIPATTRLSISALFIVSMFVANPVCAAITNHTSGGFAYTTLNDALFMANYGDTLYISTGIYNETMFIHRKSLNLLGGYSFDFKTRTNNPACTVINGGAAASVISIEDHCTLLLVYRPRFLGHGLAVN